MKIRKHLIYVITVIATFGLGVFANNAAAFLSNQQFAETGSQESQNFRSQDYTKYHLDGHLPFEFAAIEHIELPASLFRSIESGVQGGQQALVRGVPIVVGSFFVEGKDVVFQLQTSNAETYVFIGKLRNNSTCKINVDNPGLDGNLIKIKDGEVIASTKAKFHLVCGC